MRLPVVFMLSGQGSQYYQMGRELYQRHPRFRMWMDYCDEVARPLLGISLCDLLYHDGKKSQPFDRLLYSNPALLSFEYSLARVLGEAEIVPDCLLGYSLGEISALVIGGAITLEQGLRLVVEIGSLLEAESPPANMIAVLGSPAELGHYVEAGDGLWITARNFDGHFVVTGPVAATNRLIEALQRVGVAHQVLPVNYGFHTEMLQPLQQQVLNLMHQLDFGPLRVPMWSSFSGARLDAGFDCSDWPLHLWSMLRHPIAFDSTVRALLVRGDFTFVDAGPSGTLATFVKHLLGASSDSRFVEIVNPFGRDERTFAAAVRRLQTSGGHLI